MVAAAAIGVVAAAFLVRPLRGTPVNYALAQTPSASGPASPPPSSAGPGPGATSASPAPSPSASSPPPAEPTAAQALAQLLQSSTSDRSAIEAAVGDVNACGAGLARDAQAFRQAADSRRQLIGQLDTLPGASALPSAMIADLSAAWQASSQADQDFAAWADDESSGGCTQDDSADASYQAATVPDNTATSDKQEFVALWNPIAAQYGLTAYQWDQL